MGTIAEMRRHASPHAIMEAKDAKLIIDAS